MGKLCSFGSHWFCAATLCTCVAVNCSLLRSGTRAFALCVRAPALTQCLTKALDSKVHSGTSGGVLAWRPLLPRLLTLTTVCTSVCVCVRACVRASVRVK